MTGISVFKHIREIRTFIAKSFKKFTPTEKNIFFILLGLLIGAIGFSVFSTGNAIILSPDYSEGIIGFPQYINPVIASNDAEMDLIILTFASLRYDLIDDYNVTDLGKTYTIKLKPNLKWSNGRNLSADDVVFTIKTIQNKSLRSPLAANFSSIQVEKINDLTVKFNLKDSYAFFMSSLDIGILPKHIWQNINSTDFRLTKENLYPVGNGPYIISQVKRNQQGKITAVYLKNNKHFFKQPAIKSLCLRFYDQEKDLIQAWQNKKINGLSYVSGLNLSQIQQNSDLKINQIKIPRYFALFFNLDQTDLDQQQRLKLAQTLDKQALVDQVLSGYSQDCNLITYSPPTPTQLNNIKLDIIVPDFPDLVKTGQIIAKQWREKGAQINLNIIAVNKIQHTIIPNRDYEAIIFGHVLGSDPDSFAFWHSSQKKYPGLNLSNYNNPQVDALLVQARQSLDKKQREQIYQDIQTRLKQDLPAIFLYNPTYLYLTPKNITNVNLNGQEIPLPCKRLANIENWEMK